MFDVWLERWFSSCPRHLREMGCLREMLGIRRRWQRYRHTWGAHCQESRALILAAIRRCRQRRTAVVLGSGWLHDVPLTDLSAAFDRVTLVDLFHPIASRRQTRRYGNVRHLAADVTGTLEGVWRAVERAGDPLPEGRPTLRFDPDPPDLTVSLNLLSQLPCMPERYLRGGRRHDEAEIAAYCRGLIQAHLDALQRLPGVVTLIADHEVVRFDATGRVVGSKSTLYGHRLPWRYREWSWTLVPAGAGRTAEVLRVAGVEDVKTADDA